MEMTVLGGGRKYSTHDHYAGDLVMQLVAILLISQVIRLNTTLSVESLKDINKEPMLDFFSDFAPSKSIDGPYLDGVSITVGTPRKHVWSYAVGYSKTVNNSEYKVNCPCAKYRGTNPPPFVKEHYYCESGASDRPDLTTFYGSDPLWDGKGCPAGDNCCSALEAPWFYRHFVEAKDEAVEVRICRDEIYSNEATLMEQVELYIQ